jgi:hypothetical protein
LQLDGCVLLVISKTLLDANGGGINDSVARLSEASCTNGRLITLLKDNVSMPAHLRLGDWVDFRDEREFELSVRSLVALLKCDSPRQRSGSRTAVKAEEHVLSNLFPVVELPKFIYSAETKFQTIEELTEASNEPGPLPFLLKDSRIFAAQPVAENSAITGALVPGAQWKKEDLSDWLCRPARAAWGLELLNCLLRAHAWKRGMRFDESHRIHYFSRSKPKTIWWQIGQQTIPREVTAPHMEWVRNEGGARAEAQFGWRHQAIRAEFIQVLGTLFLRLEPTWFLTQLDGKTAMTTQPVGPVSAATLDGRQPDQQRNGQVLRSLQFWSAILAKGHSELRMNTGQEPVRVRLIPVSGVGEFGFRTDEIDYDRLVLTEMDDDLSLPELSPFAKENAISNEEDLSSELS